MRRAIKDNILAIKKDLIAYLKSYLLLILINLYNYSLLSAVHITLNILKNLFYIIRNILRLSSIETLTYNLIVDNIRAKNHLRIKFLISKKR